MRNTMWYGWKHPRYMRPPTNQEATLATLPVPSNQGRHIYTRKITQEYQETWWTVDAIYTRDRTSWSTRCFCKPDDEVVKIQMSWFLGSREKHQGWHATAAFIHYNLVARAFLFFVFRFVNICALTKSFQTGLFLTLLARLKKGTGERPNLAVPSFNQSSVHYLINVWSMLE